MGAKLGMEARLYRNLGTYEEPDWDEITNVRDLTWNNEKGKADVTTRRNNGWRANLRTLKESSVEFQMVWDTEDEGFIALAAAYFHDEPVEVAVLDGDIEDPDSFGLRATMDVGTFKRSEPLEEGIMADVVLEPTYSAHPPELIGLDEEGGS